MCVRFESLARCWKRICRYQSLQVDTIVDEPITGNRLFKKAVQQGRSERRAEAYPLGYVEGLSDARTTLEDFFNSLLELTAVF